MFTDFKNTAIMYVIKGGRVGYLNEYIYLYFLNISALDAESEKLVQEALDYAVKGNYFTNEDIFKNIILIESLFLLLHIEDLGELSIRII